MIIEGPWTIAYLDENFKDAEYGIVGLPKNIFGHITSPAFTVAYAINNKSKHKKATREFFNFLLSPEGMAIFASMNHNLPTRKSVEEKLQIRTDKKIIPFIEAAQHSVPWTGSKYKPYIFNEFTNMIPLIMQGNIPVKEGLQQIDETTNSTIESVN